MVLPLHLPKGISRVSSSSSSSGFIVPLPFDTNTSSTLLPPDRNWALPQIPSGGRRVVGLSRHSYAAFSAAAMRRLLAARPPSAAKLMACNRCRRGMNGSRGYHPPLIKHQFWKMSCTTSICATTPLAGSSSTRTSYNFHGEPGRAEGRQWATRS